MISRDLVNKLNYILLESAHISGRLLFCRGDLPWREAEELAKVSQSVTDGIRDLLLELPQRLSEGGTPAEEGAGPDVWDDYWKSSGTGMLDDF